MCLIKSRTSNPLSPAQVLAQVRFGSMPRLRGQRSMARPRLGANFGAKSFLMALLFHELYWFLWMWHLPPVLLLEIGIPHVKQ